MGREMGGKARRIRLTDMPCKPCVKLSCKVTTDVYIRFPFPNFRVKERREFVETVHKLVHGDDPVTVANEEDGLGEDLLEAVETVRKILEESEDAGGG